MSGAVWRSRLSVYLCSYSRAASIYVQLSTFYCLCYASMYHAHIQYTLTQALSLFVALPVSSLKIAEFYPFSAILLFEDLCHSLVQLLPICLPSLINKELQIIWSYLRLVSASHFALPHRLFLRAVVKKSKNLLVG